MELIGVDAPSSGGFLEPLADADRPTWAGRIGGGALARASTAPAAKRQTRSGTGFGQAAACPCPSTAIDIRSRRHVEALCFGDMATETSTIRVTRATRDLLAEQARERGVSVAALVGEIAEERRRDAIWRSEHEANRVDERNPDTQAEFREWEGTLEDGLD
jgi:post-segregation antitoxin (ccd killing protein)